jgi:tetratricopeptide (TPR) repeat protein
LRHFIFLLVLAGSACARAPQPAQVAPAEIPSLLARAQQHPEDVRARFRLAAAMAAGGRCDTAVLVAQAASSLAPDDALGPLVVGGCQEQAGRYDSAVATYNDFAAAHPTARGVAAVLAKAQLALRAGAEQTARTALSRETELTQLPPEPSTLAVLPLVVSGDSSVQPLSRGLAELLTTDLAAIRRLRLLERVQVSALVDELKLTQGAAVDPATAARVGRLLRAERMVQGVATIPPRGQIALSASVVTGTGTVRAVSPVTGPFADLLDLEKRLVIDLSGQLGIELTQAERERIMREGPKNLAAFLAYSEGLDAMDRGDYPAATRAFGAALRADPTFQPAREAQQAADVAPAVQVNALAVVAAGEVGARATAPLHGALDATSRDVAPSTGDIFNAVGTETRTGTDLTTRQATPENQGPTLAGGTGIIHIIFRRPK